MASVALLSNPRSTGNRALLPRVREYCAAHPDIFHYEVEDVDQIGEAIRTIAMVSPRVVAINGRAQLVDPLAHLVGTLAVACVPDDPPRPHVAEERLFLARQRQARAAQDRGGGHFTKQFLPAAFSLSQKAAASARLAKPVTWVR